MGHPERPERYFLIVDDLEHQRAAMKAVIKAVVDRSEFMEAETFVRAEEIVKKEGDPIDVAVVDLKLEGSDKDGIELIKMIKGTPHRQGTRIVLITAHPDAENQALAAEAGADIYISKLNNSLTEELQAAIKKLLHLK